MDGCRNRRRRRDPVQRRFHLAVVWRVAAAGPRIVGAPELDNPPRRIFHDFTAGDEISIAQPHLAAWREPEEFLRRIFHEIVAFDEYFAPERNLTRSRRSIFGVIKRLDPLV